MRRLMLAAALLAALGGTAPALAEPPAGGPPIAGAPMVGPPSDGPPTAGPGGPPSPEMRAARAAVRETCSADVARLCPDTRPGGGAVMACVRQHLDAVSAPCKDALMKLRAARRAAKG